MLMGKGGVGKTTMAAAVAVELAHRGLPVHLTTSDPAAHLTETLNGSLANLTVSRIDPHAETERYRQHVLATKGAALDDQGRALLEEDLRSPCTEEIAVFQAFSRVIREAQKEVCGHGYRSHRPYPAAARCHRRLSPRDHAPDGGQQRALRYADDAVAGPETDQGAAGYVGRNHAGAGSRQFAGRSAPRLRSSHGHGSSTIAWPPPPCTRRCCAAGRATNARKSRQWPASMPSATQWYRCCAKSLSAWSACASW
ncbi:ArsA-related P-loop ATPase [Paludibacterium denitrificans]|uniref:ArsA-related P-loop ATPase n=1 Tax=Paludibacterium denitrificans TaxID=2675226 RepID=UPI00406BC411